MIDWHEELLKRGFTFLESSTRTYGNGKFIGQVVEDKENEVFYPFFNPDNYPKEESWRYRSVKISNINELEEYLKIT